MYFVGSNSDLFSASVTPVMYAMSCYIGARYNGTGLYMVMFLKISSPLAMKVVQITISDAASDDNFVKMKTTLFQCYVIREDK